jgi:hypothetical protein
MTKEEWDEFMALLQALKEETNVKHSLPEFEEDK